MFSVGQRLKAGRRNLFVAVGTKSVLAGFEPADRCCNFVVEILNMCGEAQVGLALTRRHAIAKFLIGRAAVDVVFGKCALLGVESFELLRQV